MIKLVIVFIYLGLYTLSIYRFKIAVSCFVFTLFLQSQFSLLIPSNSFFSLIIIYHYFKNGNLRGFINRQNKFSRNLLLVTFAIGLLQFAYIFRSTNLLSRYDEVDSVSNLDHISTLIRIFITSFAMYITLRTAILSDFRYRISHSLVYSALFFAITLPFTKQLDSIGVVVRDAVRIHENNTVVDLADRFSGLFCAGDVNSLGAFLAMTAGLVLLNNFYTRRSFKLMEFVYLGVLLFGILMTASRMALGMYVISVSYGLFLYAKEKEFKKLFQFTVLFICAAALGITYLGSNERLLFVFDRAAEKGVTDEISGEGARYIRWLEFLYFSTDDTIRFLFGSDKMLHVLGLHKWKDPHNFYLRMLFFNGAIVTSIFFYIYMAWLFVVSKVLKFYNFRHVLICVLLATFIISQDTPFIISIFIITIAYYNKLEEKRFVC